MSRCFPFPPPGYEKKPRSSEHGDLLAKEKHKEKKHKKEKKDKERGEGKDRKEKDKIKHRDKKERKEKHNDKKKDKDREKDKSKTSDDQRSEHQTEVWYETKHVGDSRTAEEVRDSKFTEELGRRIRDEEPKAATCMVQDLSATTSRRSENMGASTARGKESVPANKIPDLAMQKRNEKVTSSFRKSPQAIRTAISKEKQKVASNEKVMDFTSADRRRNESLTPPMQKRIETLATDTAIQNQSAAGNPMVDFHPAEQRKSHTTVHPVNKFSSPVQRRSEGMLTCHSMEKEKVANNNTVSNCISTTKRDVELDKLVENITSSIAKTDSFAAAPETEKERSIFAKNTRTEQRSDGMGLQPEKDKTVEKNVDKKEKSKEKKAEDRKKGHMDRDKSEKKRKEKEKDRHKERKKEEKTMEKGEHKHRKLDKLSGSGEDQIVSLSSNTLFAPLIQDVETAVPEGNNKKRKEVEINGFLHEPQPDGRPNKLPRTGGSSSSPVVENGRLGSNHLVSPSYSIKVGALNNTNIKKGPDNYSNHVNGKAAAELSHVLKPPVPPVPSVALGSSKNGQVRSRPPHPDTRYLSTIYSVPKLEEVAGSDDQDWLFSGEIPQRKTKPEADGTPPHVWAKGLQIDAADVFALPYVVPF